MNLACKAWVYLCCRLQLGSMYLGVPEQRRVTLRNNCRLPCKYVWLWQQQQQHHQLRQEQQQTQQQQQQRLKGQQEQPQQLEQSDELDGGHLEQEEPAAAGHASKLQKEATEEQRSEEEQQLPHTSKGVTAWLPQPPPPQQQHEEEEGEGHSRQPAGVIGLEIHPREGCLMPGEMALYEFARSMTQHLTASELRM